MATRIERLAYNAQAFNPDEARLLPVERRLHSAPELSTQAEHYGTMAGDLAAENEKRWSCCPHRSLIDASMERDARHCQGAGSTEAPRPEAEQ